MLHWILWIEKKFKLLSFLNFLLAVDLTQLTWIEKSFFDPTICKHKIYEGVLKTIVQKRKKNGWSQRKQNRSGDEVHQDNVDFINNAYDKVLEY